MSASIKDSQVDIERIQNMNLVKKKSKKGQHSRQASQDTAEGLQTSMKKSRLGGDSIGGTVAKDRVQQIDDFTTNSNIDSSR